LLNIYVDKLGVKILKKDEIREHYVSFQKWLQSLNDLDNQVWFAPIANGKWSTAAIISHLLFWDRYSFNERFPAFQQDAQLERFPNFQEVNNAANEFAHSGVSKEQLIQEILNEREQYFQFIEKFDKEGLDISFSIGDHRLTVGEYFEDFIGHDLHHQRQITEFIKI
jgi:hypothetical protein